MSSPIDTHRSPTPPLASKAKKTRTEPPSPESVAPVVAAALPLPAIHNQPPFPPDLLDRLQKNIDVHTPITGEMATLTDVRAYIRAMHLPQATRTHIGAQQASPRIIVNTFTEFCTKHPQSFLAQVCRPAMQRMLIQDPTIPIHHALSQVLADYLDRPLPDTLRFRDVEAYFETLETFYQTSLHRSYDQFFRLLLQGSPLEQPEDETEHLHDLHVLLNEPAPTNQPLTIETIGRLIIKCSQNQPVLAALRSVMTTTTFTEQDQEDLPPVHLPPAPGVRLPPGVEVIVIPEDNAPVIHDIDLRNQTNLRRLEMLNTHTTDIHLENNPALTHLTVTDNLLRTLDLSHHLALNAVNVSHNQLETLTLVDHPDLRILDVEQNLLQELDLAYCPTLERVNLSNNHLQRLTLNNHPHLQSLEISHNQLEILTLSSTPQLYMLAIENNPLATLDLTQLPRLQQLHARGNRLETLDLRHNSDLSLIDVRDNPGLQELDLRNNPNVHTIFVDAHVNILLPATLPHTPRIIRRTI